MGLTKKRIPADERKKLIIRSAVEVFSESNYHLAKVPEIAKLADVSEAMVYKYFKTKKCLFLTTLTRIGQKTIDRLYINNYQGPSNAKENIEYVSWDYLRTMNNSNKELTIFYQAISEKNDECVKKTLQAIYQSYAKFFQEIIEKGIEKKEINSQVNAINYSWQLVGHLIHLSTFYLLDLYSEENAQEVIQQHLQKLDIN